MEFLFEVRVDWHWLHLLFVSLLKNVSKLEGLLVLEGLSNGHRVSFLELTD